MLYWLAFHDDPSPLHAQPHPLVLRGKFRPGYEDEAGHVSPGQQDNQRRQGAVDPLVIGEVIQVETKIDLETSNRTAPSSAPGQM